MESVLSATGIGVVYGATVALDSVDFEVRAGEVHALVGENGAGKSTLLRVLAGAERPTRGARHLDAAAQLAWVPQEAELPADLRVEEWIFLAAELRRRSGWLQRRAMREQSVAALQRVGCTAAPRARLGELSASQRKQVQLARALRTAPDVLLLDEPTAALGAAEAAQLFAALRAALAAGTAVVYVSHRLDEVMALADRVTVLRDGRRVCCEAIGAVDVHGLVQRMVGREIRRVERGPGGAGGAEVLRVRGLAVGRVRDLSLTLRAGEIVGLAGLVGAGRSAILECLAGRRRRRGGVVTADAVPRLVPADRARQGLVAALNLRENLFLPAPGWRLRAAAERRETDAWIARLAIRAGGSDAAVDSLSGGNQQKLLLARALRHAPRILLLDEPTAGVDVGAKAEIHALVRALAAGGAAVLLASSDLPELLELSDRIIALYRGAPVGELGGAQASEPRLAALISGVPPDGAGA